MFTKPVNNETISIGKLSIGISKKITAARGFNPLLYVRRPGKTGRSEGGNAEPLALCAMALAFDMEHDFWKP